MTISKKKPSKATSTANPKTSRSKVKEPVLHLKTYHFDKKDLKKLAKDNDVDIKDEADLTTGRKCRAGVNKQLTSIKRIHTENKGLIMQFKKELVNHDLNKANEYIDILAPAWNKLDTSIKNIELQIAVKRQAGIDAKDYILETINNKVSNCSTKDELKVVLKEIKTGKEVYNDWDTTTWPREYQTAGVDNMNAIQDGLHHAEIEAALKVKKIEAGIDFKNVESNGTTPDEVDINLRDNASCKYNDSQLITMIEDIGGSKGWTANIGTSGISIYQNPGSSLSLRTALERAIDDHKNSTI